MAIDDKVVAMSFESSKFESGIRSSISALDKLKSSLQFSGVSNGLNNVSSSINALNRISFRPLNSSIDSVRAHFSAFNVIAGAALGHLTIQAVNFAERFTKALTIGPLAQGLDIYQTKLQAIQTILANTGSAGVKMRDVTKALNELNVYSNKTIYSFGEMTKNIGTFTAAGVDLKTSVAAIKGIANLAALSGSNSQQAATAMYQLSQALAAGQVHLQDWNSVVNAGLGGAVFQRALVQTAVALGKIKESSVKLVGPMKNVTVAGQTFRQSLQTKGGGPSWLTSDVLSKTLANFTGDMTKAQLAAEGFNAAQIKAIQATAKTALNAAVQVKSFSQLMDVTKETIATGWAKTFEIIVGNLTEAKKLFTGISNSLNNIINRSAATRNKILGDWKDLGGRTVLLKALKDVFQALGDVLRPIRQAFRDIFPRDTGRQLYDLTLRFKAFTDRLKPSPQTVENLRRTFRGLFAVVDIGKQALGGILTLFEKLFHAVGGGSGGFLKLTGNIGDLLYHLDQTLKKGNDFNRFFVKMGAILAIPLKLIRELVNAINDLFSGFSSGGVSGQFDKVTAAMTPFQKVLAKVNELWHKFIKSVSDSKPTLHSINNALVSLFQNLGPAISTAISHINFEAILEVIRTGLLLGLVVMIRNFIDGTTLNKTLGLFGDKVGKGFAKNLGGGILGKLGDSFKNLTGSLKAMQRDVQAQTLERIAIAIALLTASVVALSFLNSSQLNRSITALAFMFGELIATMKLLDKFSGKGTVIKLPVIAASLVLLAGAVDLLVVAVIALSRIKGEQLGRGLGAVAALLGTLAAVAGPLGKAGPGLIFAGAGITEIAVALNIMAFAVAKFGNMNLQQLGKGIGAIAAALTVIAVTVRAMPKTLVLQGTGLIAVAAGLEILADVVKRFGNLDWRTIEKGLAGVGGSLLAIAIAMKLMPLSLPITATGLILVSLALIKIGDAVKKMGGLSLREIGKGLGTLAGSLIILAASLRAMSGTLGGAAALTVAAVGISLLTHSLVELGKQSWREIIKSMVSLAAALTIISIAGLALSEAIPALLGFGAALVLIGGGIALTGAGIALIGVGLSAIAVAGPTAIGILLKALEDLGTAIPKMITNLYLGLLAVAQGIAKTAPAFIKAALKIVQALLTVVIKAAPKIGKAFEALLTAGLKVLRDKGPDVIKAGFRLILELLKGIRNNIGSIIKVAAQVVVNFLKGITQSIGDVVDAGFNFIVKLVAGIVKGFLKLINAGARAIVKFLNGVADAIDKYEPQIIHAGFRIGVAIVKGMIKGIGSEAGGLIHKVKGLGEKALDTLKHPWKVFSPSQTTTELGKNIIKGLGLGIGDPTHSKRVYETVYRLATNVVRIFKAVFGIASPSKVMIQIGQEVNQGFAQGLKGSPDQIRQAFKDLNDKLIQGSASARQIIASEEDKLKKLQTKPVQNAKAIKDAQTIINQNKDVLAKTVAGHKELTKTLANEKAELVKLSAEYNGVSDNLKNATQKLADAKRLRDDAFASYKDQFGTLPSIDQTAIDQVGSYEKALAIQAQAVAHYADTLKQLRKLGLDAVTYKKLLEEGTVDQTFADQLLAGGKGAVDQLNKLDDTLQTNASSLAKDASMSLYQAGVNVAQGIVDGLKSKHKDLKAEMDNLAQEMVTQVKKSLGIKSPSTVFAEIGQFAGEGISQGLIQSSKIVTDSVYMVANDAMGAMRDSLGMISTAIANEVDPNPTITPVLDLTQVQKQAKTLGSILDKSSIGVSARIHAANIVPDISVSDSQNVSSGGTSISLQQNNFSPKELTPIEIYRQTKNQLSQLKSLVPK